ncbi:hypothetical protein LC612_29260 [Nostoc sp. CHAB 5834]|nr:hypothetical protein [Nostoc sp. CHAB 5834]
MNQSQGIPYYRDFFQHYGLQKGQVFRSNEGLNTHLTVKDVTAFASQGKIQVHNETTGELELVDVSLLAFSRGYTQVHQPDGPLHGYIPPWLEPQLSERELAVLRHRKVKFCNRDHDDNFLGRGIQLVESPMGSFVIDANRRMVVG